MGPFCHLPTLQGHVMDRRKKALTDYKKLRAFFAEEEQHFLQEAGKDEGALEDEQADPTERFQSLLQAVSELERKHRNLGLSMLLQVCAGGLGGRRPRPLGVPSKAQSHSPASGKWPPGLELRMKRWSRTRV